MSKVQRAKLKGLIAPPPSHDRAAAQAPDNVPAQLRDADVPAAVLGPQELPTPRATARSPRAKPKPKPAAEVELKDYAHRSLYAKPDTLDLIREIAFKERVSAQALYREGLFLMLRKRGLYKDKTPDDV